MTKAKTCILILFIVSSVVIASAEEAENSFPAPLKRKADSSELVEYKNTLSRRINVAWSSGLDPFSAKPEDILSYALGTSKDIIARFRKHDEGDNGKGITYRFLNLLLCTTGAILSKSSRQEKEDYRSAFFAASLLCELDVLQLSANTPWEKAQYSSFARKVLIEKDVLEEYENHIRTKALEIDIDANLPVAERLARWSAKFDDNPVMDGILLQWLFKNTRKQDLIKPFDGRIDLCGYSFPSICKKYIRDDIYLQKFGDKPRALLKGRILILLSDEISKVGFPYYATQMFQQTLLSMSLGLYRTFWGSWTPEVRSTILPLLTEHSHEQERQKERFLTNPFELVAKKEFETGTCWFPVDISLKGKQKVSSNGYSIFPIVHIITPDPREGRGSSGFFSLLTYARNNSNFFKIVLGLSPFYDIRFDSDEQRIHVSRREGTSINHQLEVSCTDADILRSFIANGERCKNGMMSLNPACVNHENFQNDMTARIFVRFQQTTTSVRTFWDRCTFTGVLTYERPLFSLHTAPKKGTVPDKVMIGFIWNGFEEDDTFLCGRVSLRNPYPGEMIWSAREFVMNEKNVRIMEYVKKEEVKLNSTLDERWEQSLELIKQLKSGEASILDVQ